MHTNMCRCTSIYIYIHPCMCKHTQHARTIQLVIPHQKHRPARLVPRHGAQPLFMYMYVMYGGWCVGCVKGGGERERKREMGRVRHVYTCIHPSIHTHRQPSTTTHTYIHTQKITHTLLPSHTHTPAQPPPSPIHPYTTIHTHIHTYPKNKKVTHTPSPPRPSPRPLKRTAGS